MSGVAQHGPDAGRWLDRFVDGQLERHALFGVRRDEMWGAYVAWIDRVDVPRSARLTRTSFTRFLRVRHGIGADRARYLGCYLRDRYERVE